MKKRNDMKIQVDAGEQEKKAFYCQVDQVWRIMRVQKWYLNKILLTTFSPPFSSLQERQM